MSAYKLDINGIADVRRVQEARKKNEKEIFYLLASAPHFGLPSHNLCHFNEGEEGS